MKCCRERGGARGKEGGEEEGAFVGKSVYLVQWYDLKNLGWPMELCTIAAGRNVQSTAGVRLLYNTNLYCRVDRIVLSWVCNSVREISSHSDRTSEGVH